MIGKCCRDVIGKAIPIDGKSAAGGQLVLVGRTEDQRTGTAHFLVQQANGIVLCIIGAEGVRADEFGTAIGLVRIRAADWAHLMKDDRNTRRCKLPRSFRTSQASADDMNGFWSSYYHERVITCLRRIDNKADARND